MATRLRLRLGWITQGSSGASFFNQVTCGYSPADQIASKTATNASYNYTPAAKNVSYGIDGLNRIGTIGATNMADDVRGKMTGDGYGITSKTLTIFDAGEAVECDLGPYYDSVAKNQLLEPGPGNLTLTSLCPNAIR